MRCQVQQVLPSCGSQFRFAHDFLYHFQCVVSNICHYCTCALAQRDESYPTPLPPVTIEKRDDGAYLRLRRWLPPLLWAGVILFATSMPTDFVPKQVSAFDKVAHFSMYGVFAFLFTSAAMGGRFAQRAAIVAVVCVTAFGAADEWHQRFIPGRSTEFADWVADTSGAIVGTAAAILYRRRRPRLIET